MFVKIRVHLVIDALVKQVWSQQHQNKNFKHNLTSVSVLLTFQSNAIHCTVEITCMKPHGLSDLFV